MVYPLRPCRANRITGLCSALCLLRHPSGRASLRLLHARHLHRPLSFPAPILAGLPNSDPFDAAASSLPLPYAVLILADSRAASKFVVADNGA
jgi:hypothetical protein